ncbi:MAG: V-type ATP synthase subunit E [Sedimentisphaerales bacterium]|nr:V-type ATP synthase subunit E [Sedimentisphaerales bacterium]
MESEQVTNKILADAEAEAEKIKSDAGQKQAAEQAEFQEKLGNYQQQTHTLAQNAAKEKKERMLASARMQSAKQLLTEKRAILDEVFSQARKRLEKLLEQDYKKLMKKLMLEAVETGEEEVIVDYNEKVIDQSFIDEINKLLKDNGSIKLAEEKRKMSGGFILDRGKIKTNVTFDVLIARVRTELEVELAKELFKAEQ